MRGLAWLLALGGLVLLGANVYGLGRSERHPRAGVGSPQIVDDVRWGSEEARARLLAAREIEDFGARMQAVNTAIAGGLAHYWPEPGEADADLPVPLWKNWLLWLVARLDPILHPLFGSARGDLLRYEFRNADDALERGIGLCSQAGMATVQVLLDAGVDASLVSLGGHTIATARAPDGREFILDADYGVVLPFGLAHADAHPDDVVRHYEQAGYDAATARWVADIYGSEGNRVVWGGAAGTAPGRVRLERTAQWAKWWGPVVMLAPAALLLARRRQRA
jgi:hypothetical protein